MLPSHDIEYLSAKVPGHQLTSEGGIICVVVPDYPLPAGFDCLLKTATDKSPRGVTAPDL